MKPFHTIAIPHDDILQGRLTMDVFAADLWEVFQGRGPEEYRDPDIFDRKTYKTEGLENLLSIVKRRLHGQGGDPVIQIQTPFGGGKTHSLIALYHQAKVMGINTVVIVGTALSTDTPLWSVLEQQLTGRVQRCSGTSSPGRDVLKSLLSSHSPVLILMDEVLEYVTKAASVTVGESTLAAQTIAFVQELTETMATCENACFVVALPASLMEHYDQKAEELYQQLQKVSGRIEKIYTPVQEHEITRIIRQRLFSHVNENDVKKSVAKFMDYAEQEGILPQGMEPSEYRERFIASYPFMPEVVDTLYHQWGSFPTFQRTRGVLRLLSLVIYSLRDSKNTYISLADFDLGTQEIRQELLKHIGPEYNSVIAADITDARAGALVVDSLLGKSYQGLNLGKRTATTIFMYSFSGGSERGTTIGHIKRSATTLHNPSSVIVDAIELLKQKLFYLQVSDGRFYFKNQPNINRIILSKMENTGKDDLVEKERELLLNNLSKGKFDIYIWPERSIEIPDNESFKLIILPRENRDLIEEIKVMKGSTPRVNRNTIFFLYPQESERPGFVNQLKRHLAYEKILSDKEIGLTDDQKKEIQKLYQASQDNIKEAILRLYQVLEVPAKKPYSIGIPTYGEKKTLDSRVYDELRSSGEILEMTTPLLIYKKYIEKSRYVPTQQIYLSTLRTPGEPRFSSREVLEKAISQGIAEGLFGVGLITENGPQCRHFKERVSVSLVEGEVILDPLLCKTEEIEIKPEREEKGSDFEKKEIWKTRKDEGAEPEPAHPQKIRKELCLTVPLQTGRFSDLSRILKLIDTKFRTVFITISAKDGEILESEFNNSIREAFEQMGIHLDDTSKS